MKADSSHACKATPGEGTRQSPRCQSLRLFDVHPFVKESAWEKAHRDHVRHRALPSLSDFSCIYPGENEELRSPLPRMSVWRRYRRDAWGTKQEEKPLASPSLCLSDEKDDLKCLCLRKGNGNYIIICCEVPLVLNYLYSEEFNTDIGCSWHPIERDQVTE